MEKSINVLGHIITPEIVCEAIKKASDINWGTHLLRWRYFDVTHAGITYNRNSLIPTKKMRNWKGESREAFFTSFKANYLQ